MREDVETVIEGLDITAMSSDYEGTPLFAVECMAAGKPLVATRVGGLPDLVEDGVSGLLVPPRDPAALAAGISSLLADERAAAPNRRGGAGALGPVHDGAHRRPVHGALREALAEAR